MEEERDSDGEEKSKSCRRWEDSKAVRRGMSRNKEKREKMNKRPGLGRL